MKSNFAKAKRLAREQRIARRAAQTDFEVVEASTGIIHGPGNYDWCVQLAAGLTSGGTPCAIRPRDGAFLIVRRRI